ATGLPPEFDASRYLTKEDMAATLGEFSNRFATTVKDVGRIASRHAANYKEELDMEALDKLAVDMAKQ
ncbi:hypothetical protein, partial [Brachyspira hyodysenteriae]|uniref:hypothetical protein n=1 Tax=Brachyspira hyodysenteriae TaxID=159 RepID=UPI0015C41550